MRKLLSLSLILFSTFAFSQSYQRATTTDENVKNKLFPKSEMWEVSAPAVGIILNQSYIDSFLIHGAVSYFLNESWGLSVEGAWVSNSDKAERYCIEHFYNDSFNQVPVSCPRTDADAKGGLLNKDGSAVKGANVGPAYVPIRELNALAFLTATWNPIYGKQLAFLSASSYFDIFTTFGIGAAFSTFYPESLSLRNGKIGRGDADPKLTGCPSNFGACPTDPNFYALIGKNGRPEPEDQISPLLTVGIGQKFHFFKRYHLKTEVRNFTLIGGPLGYESHFALWVGLGMRF